MTDNPVRKTVLDFLEAIHSGNTERALALCTEDIDYLSHAPVNLLPHLGHRHGHQELAETWKALHTRYSSMRYEVSHLIVDGEQAACIIRSFFRKSGRDRVVQTDLADFYTFRSGRIAQIRQFMDSFNVVEQVLERDVSALLDQPKGAE